MKISLENGSGKLRRFAQSSSSFVVRLEINEGSAILFGKVAHLYEGDRIIFKLDNHGTLMILLAEVSFEDESKPDSSVESLTIRFPGGGRCYLIETLGEEWPSLIGDFEN